MNGLFYDDEWLKLDAGSREKMEKYGWFVHFVPDDEDCPNSVNYHTHGVERSFGHPDLQICFPLSRDIAHSILSNIVDDIKAGSRFEPGKKYNEIIGGGLSVEFIHAMECGRKVLRIIFPDKNGNYEGAVFQDQFERTGL